MNRYPSWKYALLVIALLVGLVYTLPNFFGEAPAVQVSSGKATLKLDASMAPRVEQVLTQAGLKADFVQFEGNSVKARFADLDAQRKAKDAIGAALNPDPADPSYIVALNLLSRSPHWLTSVHALPMYLGLDLRGGVHFLMQVDMSAEKQDEHIQTLNNSLAAAFTAKAAIITSERIDDLTERLESLEELLPDAENVAIDESMVLDLSGHASRKILPINP